MPASHAPRPTAKHVYRADIDGLRAIAIVPVLLFHLRVPGFTGGFVGVDVFFVISGYLITSILLPEVRQGTFSFAYFYERRARRLFPALFLVLAAVTIAAVPILLPSDLRSYAVGLGATTVFGANILFWQTAGYFDGPAEMKPLLHTWSLSVEEQFYIVFPTILMAVQRWMPHRMRHVIAAIAVTSFAASVWYLGTRPDAVFYLTTFRAWELMIGALLALEAFPAITRQWLRETAAIVGLLLIAFAVVGYSGQTPFPGATALLPTVGTALLILAGSSGSSAVTRALSVRPLVATGLISYPLYLWHWPIIVLSQYYLVTHLSATAKGTIVVISFLLAQLTFRYVERPFRARGRFTRKGVFALSAAGGAVLLLVAGFIRVSDGWPSRLTPGERLLEAAATEAYRPHPDCYREPLDDRPPEGCPIGVPGRPTVLVWGDSHVMAMFTAFDSAAQRAGVSGLFVAKAGCPPLIGVARYDREGHDCVSFNDAVTRILDRNPTIRSVFLGSRWAINANGQRYGVEQGAPVVLSPGGVADNPREFHDGLERTLAYLTQRNVGVTFITQVPEVGWDVPSTLVRASHFGRVPPAPPSVAEYRARQAIVDSSLAQVRARYPVRVVDVAPAFCDDSTCSVEREGRPLYRDGHHISEFGAIALTPLIERALRAADAADTLPADTLQPGSPRQPTR